jgi:hypothetical protein
MAEGFEREDAIRALQAALDFVDAAKSLIVSTAACQLLEKAHGKICVGITHLNDGESGGCGSKRDIDPAVRRPQTLLPGSPVSATKRRPGRVRKLRE